MIPELNPVDLQTIRALLSSKTDDEISTIIELPVSVVREVIIEMDISGEERNEQVNKIIEVRTLKLENKKKPYKKAGNIQDILKKQKKQRDEGRRLTIESNRKREVTDRENRRTFKTKPVDLSTMISIKIDHKTIVFVKPGTDIEKVRQQYIKLKSLKGANPVLTYTQKKSKNI